jgi:hypothetical protein
MIVQLFIDLRTNQPLDLRKRFFAWIGAHSNHGKTTGWIGGLWYLINLPIIIRGSLVFYL